MRIALIIGGSLLSLVVLFLIVTIVLCALPKDYFVRKEPTKTQKWTSPLGFVLFVVRNVVGVVLIVSGLILVLPVFPLLPGSGFLVSAVGLIMSDIPGRQKLLMLILKPKNVANLINNVRQKFGREAFEFPETIDMSITKSPMERSASHPSQPEHVTQDTKQEPAERIVEER